MGQQTKRYRPAKSETIRNINSTLILNLIRSRQPISRAEVARRTGLQRSTISQIVNALLDQEVIVETGAGLSSGGRRPTLMRLNAERFCVFGVSIDVRESVLAMSDLNGEVVYRESFQPPASPEGMFAEISARINRIIESQSGRRLHYEGVGITVPGLVDYSTGEFLFAPNLGWRRVRVEKHMDLRVPMPVYVDNDANAAAMAEAWYGASADHPANLVLVYVSEGVGAGMVFNDEVYRGANGTAGEFGHMVLMLDGEPCRCGNRGCWEVYASDSATLARYRRLGGRASGLTIQGLIGRARAGDEAARDALTEAARYLGVGIGNIISGLNPREIIVSGDIAEGWDLIELPLKSAIAHGIQHDRTRTVVRRSRLGQEGLLLGAVALAISRRFSFTRAALAAG